MAVVHPLPSPPRAVPSTPRPLSEEPQGAHPPAVLERLRELPTRFLRHILIWLSHRQALGRLAVSAPWTRRIVRRFIPAPDLSTAVRVIADLQSTGFHTLADVLGEAVTSAEAADAAVLRYVATVEALDGAGLEADVSVKLTHLGLDVDHELCRENLGRIAERAAAVGAAVQMDMEDSSRTDRTFAVWDAVHAAGHDVRIAVQAYLRRSPTDIERLIEERARVRLCKGAYDEPSGIAYRDRAEVDAQYALLMERLLTAGVSPALATHDDRLIERAIAIAGHLGLARDGFEFQMLYGVRPDLQERLRAEGYRVRLYVPYGTEWYPYYMRRMAERPANLLLGLRSVIDEIRRGRRAPASASRRSPS